MGAGVNARRRGWGLALLTGAAVLCAPPAAVAAAHTNETFSTGAAGWCGSGSLSVTGLLGETLRGRFNAQGVPTPEIGSFVCTNLSTGGAFAGDYPSARAGLLGFSIKAQQTLPSDMVLRLYGPGGSFFRSLTNHVKSVGVWYHFTISLQSRGQGSWLGGGDEAFGAALRDVRWLQIQVQRNGAQAQEYLLDDVFLAAPAQAAGLAGADGPALQIEWTDLRTATVYEVEGRPHGPGDSWAPLGSITAIAPTAVWSTPLAELPPAGSYRLVCPEIR